MVSGNDEKAMAATPVEAIVSPIVPFYDRDGITIYCGDSVEIMPTIEADVIITDPPYGTGYYATDTACFSAGVLRAWKARAKSVCVFGWAERLVALCVASGMTVDQWITWWPTNGALRGFNTVGLWRETEHIAWFGEHVFETLKEPRSDFGAWVNEKWQDEEKQSEQVRIKGTGTKDRRLSDVWREHSPHLGFTANQRLHPNEKPLRVMHKLVCGAVAGTICDPFMGSGTTLLAAKMAGRRAIGIEIEERYCEVAVNRLRQGFLDFGSEG